MLDNEVTQPSKFGTKNLVERNVDVRGKYGTNSQTKFKIAMLKSSLCDYSDAYILIKGTITITADEADAAAIKADEKNKQVIFKNMHHSLSA